MARPRGTWGDKAFRDALNKAIRKRGDDGLQHLEVMADKLALAARNGDLPAIHEVADRIDGKPQQAIYATNTTFHMVVEAPKMLETAEEWENQLQRPH